MKTKYSKIPVQFVRSFYPAKNFACCQLRLTWPPAVRGGNLDDAVEAAARMFSEAAGLKLKAEDILMSSKKGSIVLTYNWSMTERTHEAVNKATEALKAAGWKESTTV